MAEIKTITTKNEKYRLIDTEARNASSEANTKVDELKSTVESNNTTINTKISGLEKTVENNNTTTKNNIKEINEKVIVNPDKWTKGYDKQLTYATNLNFFKEIKTKQQVFVRDISILIKK